MVEIKQFAGNTLAITEEQVATDWRLGLLRALGEVVTRALPNDTIGNYGAAVKGSNREHVSGGMDVRFCPLVEIYEIREEQAHRSLQDTMGGSEEVTVLKAQASCACGRLVKHPVSLDINPGTLISEVTKTSS